LIDQAGRLARSTWFVAADDGAAMTAALRFAGGAPFELWRRPETTPDGVVETVERAWIPVRSAGDACDDRGSPAN
jgi:hypothetical protein